MTYIVAMVHYCYYLSYYDLNYSCYYNLTMIIATTIMKVSGRLDSGDQVSGFTSSGYQR